MATSMGMMPLSPGADTEHYLEQNHEQQKRQRHHEIGEAHQQLIGHATKEAGNAAIHYTEQHIQQRRKEADEQRYPGTVDEPGQHVAAQIVGTEWMQRQLELIADLNRLIGTDDTPFRWPCAV